MAHTKFENLNDILNELDVIRKLQGLKEVKPGIFYFKSTPFLHFHDKDGKRWAHVKCDGVWKVVLVNFNPIKSQREKFCKIVRQAFHRISN